MNCVPRMALGSSFGRSASSTEAPQSMPAKSDGNHSDDAEDDDMDSDDEPALLGPLRAASGKAGAKRSAGSSGAGAVSGRPATSGTSGSTRSSGDTPSREIINTTQDGRFNRLKEGLEK